jgi:hypothetical protein
MQADAAQEDSAKLGKPSGALLLRQRKRCVFDPSGQAAVERSKVGSYALCVTP